MVITVRYHIVTLIAIFLALLIGILFGFALTPGGKIDMLVKTTQRLERTFQKQQSEIENQRLLISSLQTDIKHHQEFEKRIMPLIISNRLSGKTIAIVQTASPETYPEAQKLANILRQSGASVKSITWISKEFAFSSQKLKEEMSQLFGLRSSSEEEFQLDLIERMAQELVRGAQTGFLDFLAKQKLTEKWGDYKFSVDAVVLIGGSLGSEEPPVKMVDLPLVDALNKLGVLVVGCEPQKVQNSYISLYRRHRISTVDNVDTIVGQIALILVLSGKPGHFGVKETADALLPSF